MINKYYNLFIIAVLGFSSGLPLALTGTTLQGWLADENVNIVTIGMLGLVTQPYVYKFLWAPILDRFSVPIIGNFLGFRTSWILLTQILLIFAIISISFVDPVLNPLYLAFIALCISFTSATQDIAYDAYRTELLTEQQRGVGAVVYVYGYRVAMIVSGGGSLLLSYYIGWQYTYLLMAGLIALCATVTFLAIEPKRIAKPVQSFSEVIIEPFREFMSRPCAVWLLLLLITYKLGEAFAMALTTPFLIQFLHFTTKDVGLIAKTMGLIATLIGLSVGGGLINKLGLYKSLFWFGVMQAVTNLLYYLLAVIGHSYIFMAVTILMDQFSSGLATAALMVLLMSICNQKYTATQFALLSALAALGRVYVAPVSGVFVDNFGWYNFYIFSFIACFPGLIMLKMLKNSINNKSINSQEVSNSDNNNPSDPNIVLAKAD